jgi:hypothetical protein
MAHSIACNLIQTSHLASLYSFLQISWDLDSQSFLAGFVHAIIDDPLIRISLL